MTVDQTKKKKKKEQNLVQIGPGPGPDHLRTDLRPRPVPVRSGPGPAQKPTCGPVLVLVLKKLPQDQTGPGRDMASSTQCRSCSEVAAEIAMQTAEKIVWTFFQI